MSKKYIIYLDKKDLATLPVTQNDVGRYYRNSSGAYYKPTMEAFNNATLPSGYKVYTDGSHAKYKTRNDRFPWDISSLGGKGITANFKVKLISASSADGGWAKYNIVGTSYMIAFVHVDSYPKIGTIVNPGTILCKVKVMSGSHLHIDEWTGERIYNLIVKGDFKVMSNATKNKKYEFTNTDDLNVRETPNGDVVTQLKGNKKVVGLCLTDSVSKDGYNWNLYVGVNWAGWIADKWLKSTSRNLTDVSGIELSTTDCSALEKQIATLNTQISTLSKANDVLKSTTEAQLKEIEGLKTTIESSESDLATENTRLDKELRQAKLDNIDLVAQLNAIKEHKIYWVLQFYDDVSKIVKEKILHKEEIDQNEVTTQEEVK